MNRLARFPVMAAATATLIASMTGCHRLEARDQLNKGVQAYKSARYEEAINHFQEAVNLDPSLPMARIYLATAYAQQVVPDLQSPENMKTANLAIQGFQEVLGKDPNNINALKGIAALYLEIGKVDEAKQWQQKVIAADPQDAEANYTIGYIDWRQAYRNAVKELTAVGMTDDGNGNAKMPKATCQALVQQNTPLVTEGLQYMQKALDIRPNYDDAMAYMNLLNRRKADLECGNDAARKADLDQAQQWSAKMMSTRKANEEKKASQPGGIVMDQK
ncbi:tetratricopeptide repeat protein [Acidipila rosea]|uniref:Tetratricopeptide repeat protein n=1 Tax=Acidipila rosea TaxID=768535 RepID=A0A4R1L640_9BACT|nr:tetratricopeptide repeat protein [Acidipila rosea]MBW4026519.1 tetratricopeptide repeat protein [Acidobacteriota bacterium]MBW4044345.1 tetratricopeptide repeat protein [Acidobacteriota bacterium]TCK72520.1 tetratricopeptide repeat protein [Acidipila rosea]